MRLQSLLVCWTLGVQFAESKGFWASTPAAWDDFIQQAYPVGNGKLGAMPFGGPGSEKVVLNIDSLWWGGPFENASYTGGNPVSDESHYLPGIREFIFENGTGNVSGLLGSGDYYGSYQVYANLSVEISGVISTTNYNRSLSFDTGLHTTTFTANDDNTYTSTVYCSCPAQACVYDLSLSSTLPEGRLAGVTQLGPPIGMKYDGIARLSSQSGEAYCSKSGALVVPANAHNRKLTIVISAGTIYYGTDYDQTAGNLELDFSFKGSDPGPNVEKVAATAATQTETSLRTAHVEDYSALMGQFKLNLPDTAKSAGLETSIIIDRYNSSGPGDPYLESTLVSLGRHLLISSQRENSLPANLAGRWSQTITAAWSADYHANINLQMNQWGGEQTGLGSLLISTFDYMQDTWIPRGTETAKFLYDAPGWVVHDEINIFGHTGMKEEAQWANYPASAAWMMQHVYDHFTYSQDIAWFTSQGYPLLKGVAEFWLSQLQPDNFFNDGTLVVNPCNSPEHGPTTFGCTNYQQLIHQLFVNIQSSILLIPDLEPDISFIEILTKSLEKLDKGLHIGSWNEVQEWKLPDSYGYDFKNDTHRHLSQLVGWYLGYSLSSFLSAYSDPIIQSAVRTSLISRGDGDGPDADAGWEKLWRSACWALLNDTSKAYFELKFAIDENFANNGLSMYWGTDELFQIDANFGIVGATMALLIVDLPGMEEVVLGPAIPGSWGRDSVEGVRLRGGGVVGFGWDEEGVVQSAKVTGRAKGLKIVNNKGKILVDL